MVDRVKAETLNVSVGDVFNVLAGYIGSSYVNQFNKFGRTFQVYVQADAQYPPAAERYREPVRAQPGRQDGAAWHIGRRSSTMVGPSLVSLYNLYPTATINGAAGAGLQLRRGDDADGADRRPDAAARHRLRMDRDVVSGEAGRQSDLYAFGLGMLLVYLCLAGQYESWIAPLSVILAVPLSLIGPVIALTSLGLANNLYTQIGLVLLIALSAKNAILIVEVARERRMLRASRSWQAAVDAARTRFRPILMTSFAFILGVVPLVTATGAGASARVSLGLSVFSGMIASTCLAVLFVPSFFVVLQRFEEWRKARNSACRQPTTA